jgi:hypothetical protein
MKRWIALGARRTLGCRPCACLAILSVTVSSPAPDRTRPVSALRSIDLIRRSSRYDIFRPRRALLWKTQQKRQHWDHCPQTDATVAQRFFWR